ncbi:MAG TPA: hypothetical protein VL329_01935 [Nitrospiraceae bacterium]|nr:hypothetical protein [Nitrospiraceae bacterium]
MKTPAIGIPRPASYRVVMLATVLAVVSLYFNRDLLVTTTCSTAPRADLWQFAQ